MDANMGSGVLTSLADEKWVGLGLFTLAFVGRLIMGIYEPEWESKPNETN
jgi:hypothetical protein